MKQFKTLIFIEKFALTMAEKPYTFSQYLETHMKERNLKRKWIEATIENPDITDEIAADETHFFKKNT